MAASIKLAIILSLAFLIGCAPVVIKSPGDVKLTWTQSDAPPMSRAEFDELMQVISNRGRWGAEDQLGTLNLITPERRRDASALVRDGISLSMALEIDKQKHALNDPPFEHEVYLADWGGHRWAGDRYAVFYHGWAYTHLDGLQHVAHKGLLYNGYPIDDIPKDGERELGVQNIGVSGIFSRGVLIDFPRYLGIDFLPPGTAISVADLEAWEAASGVTIASGDVLLIRTGRWVKAAEDTQWNAREGSAGLHVSVAAWLRERDIAVVGSDGVTDVLPSGVEGLANPLHELLIAGLGMPLLDNLDLEAVSAAAAERDRSTFLFTGSPLRVPGGTGAPINPLAVF